MSASRGVQGVEGGQDRVAGLFLLMKLADEGLLPCGVLEIAVDKRLATAKSEQHSVAWDAFLKKAGFQWCKPFLSLVRLKLFTMSLAVWRPRGSKRP